MMEIDTKTLLAIGAALYAVYALLKDSIKMPDFSSITGIFSRDKEKKVDNSKLAILQRLWDIRSNFQKEDPIYKNITDAIENLVHYKEVMGEDNE
jgi:hypothetical protein